MKIEKFLNSFWRLQIGGWLIYFVLMFITFLSFDTTETLFEIFLIKLHRTITGFLLTCGLYYFYRRVANTHSIEKIVSISVVFSLISGVIWTGIEVLFFSQILAEYDFYKTLPRLPRTALIYALTITAWSAIYFGIQYWKQWQRERENALQAKILAEKAQLETLRYQLNPHFLFNALNSIRASIDEDKNRAKQMITQLSEFLRHSLLSGQAKEITLGEELEAVRNYLAIEKIRFEENLETEFDIDENTKDFKVPCFIINPLVENAVKHGFQTSRNTLKIRITARSANGKLLIEVANSGKLKTAENSNGTQIGLKNVRERLERLFPGKSSFDLSENNGFVSAKIEIEK